MDAKTNHELGTAILILETIGTKLAMDFKMNLSKEEIEQITIALTALKKIAIGPNQTMNKMYKTAKVIKGELKGTEGVIASLDKDHIQFIYIDMKDHTENNVILPKNDVEVIVHNVTAEG